MVGFKVLIQNNHDKIKNTRLFPYKIWLLRYSNLNTPMEMIHSTHYSYPPAEILFFELHVSFSSPFKGKIDRLELHHRNKSTDR